MTAQIPDKLYYKGLDYDLVGINDYLFDPTLHGLIPEMISTGCYRGFYCTYEVLKKGLFLTKLMIRTKDGVYPEINNVRPYFDEREYIYIYENLNYLIPYSGILRIARDFISERYVHMGFQDATSFRKVIDLTLKDGNIVDVNDRTSDIQRLRDIHVIVKDFMTRYSLDQESISEIEKRYGIPKWRIPDTFDLSIKDIDLDSIKQYLELLQKHLETPWGFVLALNNHFNEHHRIFGVDSFKELSRLGLPKEVINILQKLIDAKKQEEAVIIAFLYALTKHKSGFYFDEIIRYVITKAFESKVNNDDLVLNIISLFN